MVSGALDGVLQKRLFFLDFRHGVSFSKARNLRN